MKVPILEYNKFLEDLAKTKGMDLAEIKSKMTNCGTPGSVSVKVKINEPQLVSSITK